MARRTLLILMLTCCGLGGCGAIRHGTYVLFGGEKWDTVPAEFTELKGQKVAIVIFADQQVKYEHRSTIPLELELSWVIKDELERNVAGVEVVDPRGIVGYQNENINWDAMEKTRLGGRFGAKYVLFISLIEFTMLEPGSLNLYRGRVTAEVSVWDTSLPERDARKWYVGDLRVVHPEKAAIGTIEQNDDNIRSATEKSFAVKLVRKFYKHKVLREP